MKGIGQLIGFFLFVLPVMVWKMTFGETSLDVPCGNCNGTGKVPWTDDKHPLWWTECPICRGSGKIVRER